MKTPRPRAETPQVDVVCYDQLSRMARGQGPLPAWNRERLVRQFQGIHGAPGTAAKRLIDADERRFREVFSSYPLTPDEHR